MKHFFQQLQTDLDRLLEQAQDNENVFVRLELSVKSTRTVLLQLREYIAENGFENPEDEVVFFKNIKPVFYSRFIYYQWLYSLESRKPLGGKLALQEYYHSELKSLKHFFNRNHSFYEYYRAGWTFLDEFYFRRQGPNYHTTGDDHDFDPLFSTSHDYILAKIRAAEVLEGYLESLLSEPDKIEQGPNLQQKLKWTGDTINLVEIAYGIWLTGQMNNGNAGIAEIIRWLEKVFQVRIGRAHRRWVEIAQRKRTSYTKHLDQMKNAILQRIDNELDVK
ncbi:RteC domain-containing protein [Desertivirga brevis]|uniref:RteC domain-containing protein n=1 Tax=Desertivirga brevis TaxID=2810310 RepID=UPI001A973572|nr:RteC domain-containing protein [Pedobacter sp. SYSU D00873]